MNRIILIIFLSFILPSSVFAQLTPEQRIQDSVIGWWNKLSIPKPKPPSNGRTLTIKKQELLANFIKWMQQSYTPVGGIGTYQFKSYSSKEPSFAPAAYGVDFRVWNVSFNPPWVEANGDFKPVSEEYTRYDIIANGIPGSYAIPFINTANQYLFTWPPDGYNIKNNPAKGTSLSGNSNTGKFLTTVNELNTVFLARGNKLPFIPVTKGELLQLAEDALGRQLQAEKEAVENKWPGNIKAQEDAFEYRKQNIEKYRIKIQQLKEKHRNTLNEPAVIRTMQPTIYSFEITPDPFVISRSEETSKQYFPVYKIAPAVLEKCKTDQPQWIAVSFPYKTKEDGNQEYEMYRSLTEHFNYQYVQDYFFNPEKTKGIVYKPVNEELLNATLNNYRKKRNSKSNPPVTALPANIYFMDDFTGNTDGSKPAGWFFSTSGKHSIVTTVKKEPGKWVQLGYNNPLSASGIKKPLPENFTLEYDLLTDGEFSSVTGGAVSLILTTRPSNTNGSENIYNNGTKVKINIESGNEVGYDNNNYRGALNVNINSTPSVNKQNFSEGILYSCPLREFTDKKTSVHVAVKVKGTVLTVFINNKQVAVSTDFKMTYGGACISCGLPPGTRFNAVFWENTTKDAENVKVYLSNIKITKD